jgi:hypothetical protein
LNFEVAAIACDTPAKTAQRQMRHELSEYELALMYKTPQRCRAKRAQSGIRCSNRDQTEMLNLASKSLTYVVLM